MLHLVYCKVAGLREYFLVNNEESDLCFYNFFSYA